MPYCSKCGKEVKENQRFCAGCGQPITPSSPQPPTPAEPARRSPVVYILAAAVVAAVVAAVFFLYPRAIVFADPELDHAVRDAIGKPAGDLMQEDVEWLAELDVSYRAIRSLEGIERLTSLQMLNLSHNEITDIGPLRKLQNLKELHLEDNNLDTSAGSVARKTIDRLREQGADVTWLTTFEHRLYPIDKAFFVDQCKDGGFVVGGNSYREGVLLVKTDAAGLELWSQPVNGEYMAQAGSAQQTKDGGFVLAGRSYPGEKPVDVFLAKTDAAGKEVWSRTFDTGGALVLSVQQTQDGGFILAGVSFSVGWEEIPLLIKTDATGQEVWSASSVKKSNGDWHNPFERPRTAGLSSSASPNQPINWVMYRGWPRLMNRETNSGSAP